MRTVDFPSHYQNFILKKKTVIEEIRSILFELEHQPTGAKVIHISHDDDENLFSLSFKTYPDSSNGVAHILEHTVLCGSKKFPVKDPFFAMTRRSLNTFMNAMTGMDFTCYPASTQNEKDFYHLLDVYIDAVFFPKLEEMSFLQEGHRLELSSSDQPCPLSIEGIVYNEMKGSMNSIESRLYKKLYEALFFDLPYRFNSGGDPEVIPELSYQELKEFHARYYHPSQCIFFFYGNLPLEKHLDFIEASVLKTSRMSPPIPPLPLQTRMKAPQRVDADYPVNEKTENQDVMAVGFLTIPIKDQIDFLGLMVIEELLMESDASFLKSRLQTSQLLVQADSAIDGEMAEIPFIFIFRGMQQENAAAIEALLIQGLKDFIQEPIDSHKIDAAIHQLMIDRLEITDDQGPFGLSLFFRSVLLMQHGAMAEEGLFVHQQFDALKKKLLDPNYLKGLIEKHLIHNPHRVTVVLKANAQLEKIEQEKELAFLSKRYLAMTEEEKQAIRRQSQKLEQYQENLRHQDLSVLPSIELSDIALTHKDFPLQTLRSDQLQIHVHETWTNDFTYVDWLYELPTLRVEELSLMKFLIGIYTELGFGKEDYETTLEKIQAHTGGLSAYFQILTHIDDPKFLKPLFGLRGKALFSQIKPFFELMKKAQSGVNLDDTDRLLDLVKQTYTYLRDKINRSGLNYCIKEALSSFSPYNFINQQMSGIPYFQAISALHHEMKKEPQAVALRLKALHHKALTHLNGQLVMSLDSESLHHLKDRDFYGCGQLTTKNSTPFSLDSFHSKKQDKHLEIASPVAFVCEAYSVFTIQDPLSAALTLAPSIMESGTLHPLIREKGGAYGSGATYQSIIGNFYFHSYRDPHVADTYKAFQKSIERLINGDFDEEMLKEAKLEFIQDYDAPVTPGMRAQTSFFYAQTGRSLQFREEYKKRILSVTKNDVMEAVKKAFNHQTPCRVFACNAQLFKAEKSQLDKMGMVLITEKILKL